MPRQPPRIQALCIGAGRYQYIDTLIDAPKDAETMHNKFEDTPLCKSSLNLNPTSKEDMRKQLQNLADYSYGRPPQVTFTFYAGHGCQLTSGPLAMLPCNFKAAEEETKMEEGTFTLDELLDILYESHSTLNEIPVVFVMDACRDSIQGRSLALEAAEPRRPARTSIFCSCSRGQLASDESSFFQDLLDPEHGIFAINQRLIDGLMFALEQSRAVSGQLARSFSLEDVPKKFCIKEDKTAKSDVDQIESAGRRGIETSQQQTSPDAAIVAAYSPRAREEIEHLQSSLLQVIKGALNSFAAGTSPGKAMFMFLALFLHYKETEFSEAWLISCLHALLLQGEKGVSMMINDNLMNHRITSSSLKQWIAECCPRIDQNKLVFAALDFSVRTELQRCLNSNPDMARREREEWVANVANVCYTNDFSVQAAMDMANEYLSSRLAGREGEGLRALLSIQVFERIVETGSYVVFMRMSPLASACLSQFLAEQVRKRLHGNEGADQVFRTWISSSGWLSSISEHRELRQYLDEDEEKRLIEILCSVGQLQHFVDLTTLEGQGEKLTRRLCL